MTQMKEKYKALPLDTNDNPVPLVPSTVPLEFTRNTSISTSQEITLDTNTSVIEVNAIDGNVYLRWGTTDVTNTTAHAFIQAGGTRHYTVPKDPSTGLAYTAINLIDDGDSAKVIVIEY